jgi:hypothetical protein
LRARLKVGWTGLLVLSALAAGSAQAGVFRRADESVRCFFQAVQTNDQRLYGLVAPRLVLMATPDFGVPMALPQAREAFGKCTVLEVSPEKPLPESKDLGLATAKLSCPAIDPVKALEIAFVSRHGKLVTAYSGGMPPPRSRG